MAHYKEQGEPFVFDFKKLLMALSDKEAVAQSEVDAFMENCAKRWQTREGTYQLKRRRLKPDVGFFLLAAAWVDPGRNALQSAEQWC